MAEKTDIGWCDSSVNATSGCDGCELWNGREIRECYAGKSHENSLAKVFPKLYDPNFQNVRLIPGRMAQAAAWSDLRGKDRPEKPWLNGMPRTIFVGDMGDFESRAVSDDYIVNEILGAVKSAKGERHFWYLLTKQIHRLADLSVKIGGLPDNSMAMTSVTDQHFADHRVPLLLRADCKWLGVSAEPLKRPVRFKREWLVGIHWVIVGGLSGEAEADDGDRVGGRYCGEVQSGGRPGVC
jgi:protein gp37